jgi:hypothetical protein
MVEIEHREKHVGNGPAAGDQDHPGIGWREILMQPSAANL